MPSEGVVRDEMRKILDRVSMSLADFRLGSPLLLTPYIVIVLRRVAPLHFH